MNSTSGRSLLIYPIKRGLAEEMGARDLHGRGFGFSRFVDIGLDVTGWWEAKEKDEKIKREPYPAGHRYFPDCLRESTVRHDNRWCQITRKNRLLPKPKSRVTVRTLTMEPNRTANPMNPIKDYLRISDINI